MFVYWVSRGHDRGWIDAPSIMARFFLSNATQPWIAEAGTSRAYKRPYWHHYIWACLAVSTPESDFVFGACLFTLRGLIVRRFATPQIYFLSVGTHRICLTLAMPIRSGEQRGSPSFSGPLPPSLGHLRRRGDSGVGGQGKSSQRFTGPHVS